MARTHVILSDEVVEAALASTAGVLEEKDYP